MNSAAAEVLPDPLAVSWPAPWAQAAQAQLLFDPRSELVIDAAGAVQPLLEYENRELQGLPLQRLFDAVGAAGNAMPWHPLPAEPEGSARLATLLTKGGRARLLATRLTTFRRSRGRARLGMLLLNDTAMAVATGTRHARQRARLRTLAYELTMAEARERERLANGLHDSLGQLLAIAQLRLGELQARLPEGEQARTVELQELLMQAAQETRRATFDLHSPLLRPLGLHKAIEGLVDRVRRQCHVEIRIEGRIDTTDLSETAQAVLLRVLRELLFNAYKHARARQVMLRLVSAGDRLVVSVVDGGCGCVDLAAARGCHPEGGYGLASAEAQVQAIGGRLDLRSLPGSGTTVTVTLPCRLVRAKARASS